MTDSLLPLLAAANEFNRALLTKIGRDQELYARFAGSISADDWKESEASQQTLMRTEGALNLIQAGKEVRDATYEKLAPGLIHISEIYAQAARTVLGDADFNAIMAPEQHSAEKQQGLAAQNAPVLASAFAPQIA
ncbi:MAG TPA: hypothetical protein VL625_01245 [Patescibacteria group bacterium]|jgi:hypothetical protein|nr:hypothetical protein [Patescibacteria group bacterium]